MSEKKVQIKLRDSVSIESKIMLLLEQSGPRSGVPKQLMIAGYKAMYESGDEAVAPAPYQEENDTKSKAQEVKKAHAFSGYVAKG